MNTHIIVHALSLGRVNSMFNFVSETGYIKRGWLFYKTEPNKFRYTRVNSVKSPPLSDYVFVREWDTVSTLAVASIYDRRPLLQRPSVNVSRETFLFAISRFVAVHFDIVSRANLDPKTLSTCHQDCPRPSRFWIFIILAELLYGWIRATLCQSGETGF